MKYKLFGSGANDGISQILKNRGIEDVLAWSAADYSDINDPALFGRGPMTHAVEIFSKAVQSNFPICVIVDADADGYTSAAIIINYIISWNQEYATNNLTYILHSGKQHGLADTYEKIPKGNGLVIIPDAGM